MDWGRVRFFFSEVWRNFTRNLIMQITAVGTVAVTVILLGGFLFTRATLGSIGDDVLHQIEISVFLADSVDDTHAHGLALDLEKDPRVKSIAYVPRADGLRQMRDRFRGKLDTGLLDSNPLPNMLRVRLVDASDVDAVAASIRKHREVANVEYASNVVTRLLRLFDVLGKIGLGVVGLLVFTAAIIISNTIRLTVYARRREIAIMQLVGASGIYVRMPFIVEGLIDGLIGAALALGVLAAAQIELLPKLAVAVPFVELRAGTLNELMLSGELLATGAVIGMLAAWVSVGRYLRA